MTSKKEWRKLGFQKIADDYYKATDAVDLYWNEVIEQEIEACTTLNEFKDLWNDYSFLSSDKDLQMRDMPSTMHVNFCHALYYVKNVKKLE